MTRPGLECHHWPKWPGMSLGCSWRLGLCSGNLPSWGHQCRFLIERSVGLGGYGLIVYWQWEAVSTPSPDAWEGCELEFPARSRGWIRLDPRFP